MSDKALKEQERVKAWQDLERSVRKILQVEKMFRLKLDASLYDYGEVQTNYEFVAKPKRKR